MAPEYRLRPRAERDLEQIFDYTLDRWSKAQAEKYARLIFEALAAIAVDPQLGASAEDVKPHYRRRHVGAHVVFYKPTDYGADIIRILHQSMDVDTHFASD